MSETSMRVVESHEDWTVRHNGISWCVPMEVWEDGPAAVMKWRDDRFPSGEIRRTTVVTEVLTDEAARQHR